MQLEDYFNAFSEYLSTEDVSKLLPYVENGTNLDYLKIYRNGAIKSALDALTSNFPTVKKHIGGQLFNTICREYVSQEWPNNSCLSSYGESFSTYLAQKTGAIPSNSIDFALLDRAWLDSLFAKDEAIMSGDAIIEMIQSNPDTQINLLSSVRIITLENKCLSDWTKLKFDTSIDSSLEQQNIDSTLIIMWRNEGIVYYRALSEFEYTFINSIAVSGSLLQSAETALESDPKGDISSLFSSLITANFFANP